MQERQQIVDFLPPAVLGEANDFIVLSISQGKRQGLDGFHERTPMKLQEGELLPRGRYWNRGLILQSVPNQRLRTRVEVQRTFDDVLHEALREVGVNPIFRYKQVLCTTWLFQEVGEGFVVQM